MSKFASFTIGALGTALVIRNLELRKSVKHLHSDLRNTDSERQMLSSLLIDSLNELDRAGNRETADRIYTNMKFGNIVRKYK